jgi:hypothetical protein
MSVYVIRDEERRLLDMMDPPPFLAAHVDLVNLDDLLNCHIPGAIVRTRADPRECIQWVVPPAQEALGCVAGWISEEG